MVILLTNALTSINSMAKKDPPTTQEIETHTSEFFEGADTNHDNKISLREFKRFLKKDKKILQVMFNYNIAKREDMGENFGGSDDDIPECDSDLEAELNPPELQRDERKERARQGLDFAVQEDEDGMFEEVDMGEGDQFMAVKPWKGVIDHSVPTTYKPSKIDHEAPDANLELEYVYGYRCHDVRNNLRYTKDDKIVYHTAALGIVLDPGVNTQKFFYGHKDDVMSFALHPTKNIVATGEIGPKPLLCIWDATTLELIQSFNGPLKKGIQHLAWSKSGQFLAASAMDDEHCVMVVKENTSKKKNATKYVMVANGKGDREKLLSMTWNPTEDQIVMTGLKNVVFLTFEKGVIKSRKGTGWGKIKRKSILCSAFNGNNLITGMFNGKLVSWNGRNIGK